MKLDKCFHDMKEPDHKIAHTIHKPHMKVQIMKITADLQTYLNDVQNGFDAQFTSSLLSWISSVDESQLENYRQTLIADNLLDSRLKVPDVATGGNNANDNNATNRNPFGDVTNRYSTPPKIRLPKGKNHYTDPKH
jgi:hypothetical protein